MSDSQAFCPPTYLTATHELALFQSGEDALNNWLQDRELDNMKTAATRTLEAINNAYGAERFSDENSLFKRGAQVFGTV